MKPMIYETEKNFMLEVVKILCDRNYEVIEKVTSVKKPRLEEKYFSVIENNKEVLWFGVSKQSSKKFLIMVVLHGKTTSSRSSLALLIETVEKLGGVTWTGK